MHGQYYFQNETQIWLELDIGNFSGYTIMSVNMVWTKIKRLRHANSVANSTYFCEASAQLKSDRNSSFLYTQGSKMLESNKKLSATGC